VFARTTDWFSKFCKIFNVQLLIFNSLGNFIRQNAFNTH
jgi:hypothetical protein